MDATTNRAVPHWWNVPNQVTASRLILSIIVFVLLSLAWYLAALIIFVIAVSTDWVDGYWARKYGQVTKVGRIFDPFVDKFIICGAFIYLAAIPGSGVMPWAAVIVVARELLVTALRGQVEGVGGDFSANLAGKWKMVFQCFAAGASLLSLHVGIESQLWLLWTRWALIALALVSTIYSGLIYVFAAVRMLRGEAQSAARSSPPP